VKEFFTDLRMKIFEGELGISLLLNSIVNALRRFAIKSIKKGTKSVSEILDYIAI
jgi:hypothetical protein